MCYYLHHCTTSHVLLKTSKLVRILHLDKTRGVNLIMHTSSILIELESAKPLESVAR